MAIERALRLKGQDLNFQAAKAGAEFSQLLNEGNREAAEAKLGEARELFNYAGEIELLQAQVINRLSVLGGDIPLDRYHELVGIHPEGGTASLQDPEQVQVRDMVPSAPQRIIARFDVDDSMVHITQSTLSPVVSPSQDDLLVRPEEAIVPEKNEIEDAGLEAERELPIIKINRDDRMINIDQNGALNEVIFHKGERNIHFALFTYLSDRALEVIPTQSLKEFLQSYGSNSSVGMVMSNLRDNIGDTEKMIIETIGARKNAAYRLNAVVEPWEEDTSYESHLQAVPTESQDQDIQLESDIAQETLYLRHTIEEMQSKVQVQETDVEGDMISPSGVVQEQDMSVGVSNTEVLMEPFSIIETELMINHELSSEETYVLAQVLSTKDRNALSKHGITVGLEDRPQIREIAEKYTSEIADLDDVTQGQQREALLHKLLGYVGNKEEVFLANLANEDALFLLAFMAGVTSEDTVKELLGYITDVKKNE